MGYTCYCMLQVVTILTKTIILSVDQRASPLQLLQLNRSIDGGAMDGCLESGLRMGLSLQIDFAIVIAENSLVGGWATPLKNISQLG